MSHPGVYLKPAVPLYFGKVLSQPRIKLFILSVSCIHPPTLIAMVDLYLKRNVITTRKKNAHKNKEQNEFVDRLYHRNGWIHRMCLFYFIVS